MRKIAIGTPNMLYNHYYNLKNMVIEARIANKKIVYYEVGPDYETCLSSDLVLSMFATDKLKLRDKPFLIKENRALWTVLNRKKVKYKTKFRILLKESSAPKMRRTKHNKFKRTKK